ncbi:serine/threonine-protein kinase [Rhodopirellula sp. JC639]|uniref:serine/threonine-protein kinase n=1 Tax=Stieleria mannarensis TaxID=2755585 RepID=UPI0025702615|nr:serine/threonine-protein kinase [Rhodopirellula sp. JC639]
MNTLVPDHRTLAGRDMNEQPIDVSDDAAAPISGDPDASPNGSKVSRMKCQGRKNGFGFAAKFFRSCKSNSPGKTRESVQGRPQNPDDGAGNGDRMQSAFSETSLGSPPENRPMSFTFAPGSQPLPPYTIRRGVGVGGFGEVYFAVSQAGKEVALKRIQRNLEIELRGVSQCLNLKHPNLVSLYDICRDTDGGSWVVMEYVAGANLRDVLDRNPDGLPEAEARRWFAGIAAGVAHLHSAGLVHRDLKPGNIFDDLGIVKVGDYGLSKYISSSQRGGHTESVGTFHYMAPEIGRGKYGREIDVYAMGVMLYELLTGRVPFDGESCHEIIVKHLTALPDLSGVASPYRETILAALNKDPAKRPATIAELVAPLGLSVADAVAIPTLVSETSGEPASPTTHSESHPPNPRVSSQTVPASDEPVIGLAYPEASPAPIAADEPLLRAVRTSAHDLRRWWKSLEQSPRSRFWIGAFLAFVLFINTHWLLPALSILGAFYVPYYIIRQMVLHSSEQPSYAKAHRIASQSGSPARPRTRQEWRSEVRHLLRAKHNLVRLAELNTSWIASSLTVLTMAVAAGVIGLRSGDVSAVDVAPYFWMGLVVLVGAQGILGLGKLWERDEGEGLPRRLVLAGIGAGVGLFAYALNEFFLLPLLPGGSELLGDELPQALYREDSTIRAAGMMAHFALLFGGIRWWKSVDPLRRTRLSLWSVAVVCVAAWGVHQLIPVPQPMGLLVAGGLAMATQMSAPWINPRMFAANPWPKRNRPTPRHLREANA